MGVKWTRKNSATLQEGNLNKKNYMGNAKLAYFVGGKSLLTHDRKREERIIDSCILCSQNLHCNITSIYRIINILNQWYEPKSNGHLLEYYS
jgi:hypothetical protein